MYSCHHPMAILSISTSITNGLLVATYVLHARLSSVYFSQPSPVSSYTGRWSLNDAMIGRRLRHSTHSLLQGGHHLDASCTRRGNVGALYGSFRCVYIGALPVPCARLSSTSR